MAESNMKSSNMILLIIILVVWFVLIRGVSWFGGSGGSSDSSENNEGNGSTFPEGSGALTPANSSEGSATDVIQNTASTLRSYTV